MDHFELRPSKRGPVGAHWEVAEVIVNGRNLVDLLRDFEQPLARAEGNPSAAGQYDGLPAVIAFLPSRYYLGEPSHPSLAMGYPPGKLPVLGCDCGEVDCNPLLARITVTEKAVAWGDFENFWRGPHSGKAGPVWDYQKLGGLMFDRPEYEQALGSYRPMPPAKPSFWRRRRVQR